MHAAPALPRSTWEELVDRWQELDVPEGWRAEIIGERIVMSPPPGHEHNYLASRVHKALVRAVPDDWEIFQTAGSSVPHRNNLFVPDIAVVPREWLPAGDDAGPMPAGIALLAAEITSRSNADTDRKTKLWSYAHAQVPLYLLIDRFAECGPVVDLFCHPENGFYLESHRIPFEGKIEVPEPVPFVLDTTEFTAGRS